MTPTHPRCRFKAGDIIYSVNDDWWSFGGVEVVGFGIAKESMDGDVMVGKQDASAIPRKGWVGLPEGSGIKVKNYLWAQESEWDHLRYDTPEARMLEKLRR